MNDEFFSIVLYNSFDCCTKLSMCFHIALINFKTHKGK